MSDPADDLAAVGELVRERLEEQSRIPSDPLEDDVKAAIRGAVHDDVDPVDLASVFVAGAGLDPSTVLVVRGDGDDVEVVGFDRAVNELVAREIVPRLEFAAEMADADLYVATDGTIRDRRDDPLVDRVLDAVDNLDPRTGRSP